MPKAKIINGARGTKPYKVISALSFFILRKLFDSTIAAQNIPLSVHASTCTARIAVGPASMPSTLRSLISPKPTGKIEVKAKRTAKIPAIRLQVMP